MENNTKCEEFLGEMCLQKETDIIHLKGLFAHDAWLEEQIEPLNDLGKNLWKNNQRRTCQKSNCFGRNVWQNKKNRQVSQSKTPSSTLDTHDVSSIKDKTNM